MESVLLRFCLLTGLVFGGSFMTLVLTAGSALGASMDRWSVKNIWLAWSMSVFLVAC